MEEKTRPVKSLNVIIVVLVLILGISVFNTYSRTTKKKYEYKTQFLDDFECNDELNQLGTKGWKIVGSRRAKGYSSEFGYELILMREVK